MLLQLADVVDNEAMQVYMKPSSHEESKAPSKGFVVRDAPWATVNNEKVSAACAAGLGAQGVWHPSPRTCSEVWPSYLSWGNQACSSLGSRDSSEGLSCSPAVHAGRGQAQTLPLQLPKDCCLLPALTATLWSWWGMGDP